MKTRTLGLAAALALTLAACAEGDDDVATATPTPIDTDDTESTGDADATDGAATSDDETADPSGSGPDESIDLNGHVFDVSMDDAIEIARTEAGTQDSPYKIAIDWEDSTWQWEIDLMSGEDDWEVRIDATTGEVREAEADMEDDSEQPLTLDTLIDHDEAISAAVAQQPGRVSGWELSWEDERQVYDIEIDDDTDVRVDAETGDIVEVDD